MRCGMQSRIPMIYAKIIELFVDTVSGLMYISSMITKQTIADYVKHMLATNEKWAIRGMLKIYDRQTNDEQQSQATSHNNSVGFSGVDGGILSSFSTYYLKYNRLSPKQLTIVFRRMPRYWAQILSVIPVDKMEKLAQDAEAFRAAKSEKSVAPAESMPRSISDVETMSAPSKGWPKGTESWAAT